MTDTAAPGAPAAPPPAAPPPPQAPPLSTLTEKASQLAGSISSQPQFEAALASVPGAAALAPDDKGKLWDTVQKTRVGQGLPPMTIAAPGGPPKPVVGGETPVSPAVMGALPQSVTGQAPAPKPAAPNGPVPPPPAAGLKQVPGQDAVPVTSAPPAPTAQYKAPDLETATYNAPKYEPPKKGLQYAAMALSLLFPGAPIGRAAASFAQGLNTGADQKFKRDQDTAKTQFEAEKEKDATINQGRLATAQGQFTAAQQNDKWIASKTTADHQTQVDIYNDRQAKRAQGMDPNTGKPFVLPAQLSKPPDPKQGYDGLAAWHHARALAYEQVGATGPAAQEAASAKEATTQATNAANNARSLVEAAARQRTEIALHNDTQSHEDARHNDTVWHEDQRALLTDQRERANFGVKASAADKSLFTTWQKFTTPQTKTVEIKDVNGTVTGIHTVPMVDEKNNPVPPPISGNLQKTLTDLVNKVRRDPDPQGAAQYYSAHLDNTTGGLAGQEILQQAGEAASMRMMAEGRMPREHAFPKIVEPKQSTHPDIAQAVSVLKGMSPTEQASTIDSATTYSETEKATIRHQLGLKPPGPVVSGREQSHRIASDAAHAPPQAPYVSGFDQAHHRPQPAQ